MGTALANRIRALKKVARINMPLLIGQDCEHPPPPGAEKNTTTLIKNCSVPNRL
jgi:hypothetical protein